MGHGVMGAKLVVESPEAHAAWLQQHAHDADLAAMNTAPTDSASTAAAPASSRAR
jgi:heme/copper-type cytochrome/quinol oxidase subunit 2